MDQDSPDSQPSSPDAQSAKLLIASDSSSTKPADMVANRKKTSKHDKKSSDEMKRPKLKSYKSDILQTQWETMFSHLLDYKASKGNCLVPHRYPENPPLGAWVSTQRRQYKVWKEGRAWTGKANSTPIDPARGKRLEEIGFVWSTNNPLKIPWERRYQELVVFKENYGHCLVPSVYKANPRLGHWVSTQRHDVKMMKQGRPSRMTKERLEALEKIGFVWVAPKGGDVRGAKKRSRDQLEKEEESDQDSESQPSACMTTSRQLMADTAASIGGKRSHSALQVGANSEEAIHRPSEAESSGARGFPHQDANPFLLPSGIPLASSRLRLAAAAGGNFHYPGSFGFLEASMQPHFSVAHQMMISNSLNQALSGASLTGAGALFGGNFLGGGGGSILGGALSADPLLNARLALLHESQLLGSAELALLAARSGGSSSSCQGNGNRRNGSL